jgi:methyl acetate hydrolase
LCANQSRTFVCSREKDDIHWIASCTKLITAIACMQLVEQGKVKLDEPVGEIVPELANVEM